MVTYPIDEVKEVNQLLNQLLGSGITRIGGSEILGEQILTKKEGDKIYLLNQDETLLLLQAISDTNYLYVYRCLNYFFPRWIAYNTILESDDKYKEFASNNELLIALTSIIDMIANKNNERHDYTKRFKNFLKMHLSENDVRTLFEKLYYKDKEGKRSRFGSIEAMADYLYEVRSYIVHRAELGGVYPYNIDINMDRETSTVSDVIYMVQPKEFRRLLWKAIFNNFDLLIIN